MPVYHLLFIITCYVTKVTYNWQRLAGVIFALFGLVRLQQLFKSDWKWCENWICVKISLSALVWIQVLIKVRGWNSALLISAVTY